MTTTLIPATLEDSDVIDNLMQMYLHDLSEFFMEGVTEEGRYEYPYLDFYWQEPDRHPFLIRTGDDLAGFCLIRELSNPENGERVTDMAEFFVLRAYRRKGVGRDAALQGWVKFPGKWDVRVMQKNVRAYSFWKGIVAEVDSGFEEEKPSDANSFMTVFRFHQKGDGSIFG